MSKTHERLARTVAPKQWFLKIGEGQVFGPTDTPTLIDWARQGRVTPGNQISEDKKAWVTAERIPELEMVWMVWVVVAFAGGVLLGVIAACYFNRRAVKRMREIWPTGLSPEDWR